MTNHLIPDASERALPLLPPPFAVLYPGNYYSFTDKGEPAGFEIAKVYTAAQLAECIRADRAAAQVGAKGERKFTQEEVERFARHYADARDECRAAGAPAETPPDMRALNALRAIRDLAAFDNCAPGPAYYRVAENALAAIGMRDAIPHPHYAKGAPAETPKPDHGLNMLIAEAAYRAGSGGGAVRSDVLREIIDSVAIATPAATIGAGEGKDDLLAELCALLPGPYYMDLPDGGDTSVMEQVSRMATDAARYRWLRVNGNAQLNVMKTSAYANLDSAIDAAMRSKTSPGEAG